MRGFQEACLTRFDRLDDEGHRVVLHAPEYGNTGQIHVLVDDKTVVTVAYNFQPAMASFEVSGPAIDQALQAADVNPPDGTPPGRTSSANWGPIRVGFGWGERSPRAHWTVRPTEGLAPLEDLLAKIDGLTRPAVSFLDLIANGSHPCTYPECSATVEYDDEPFCFKHSPDEGSAVPGYSYKATHP